MSQMKLKSKIYINKVFDKRNIKDTIHNSVKEHRNWVEPKCLLMFILQKYISNTNNRYFNFN